MPNHESDTNLTPEAALRLELAELDAGPEQADDNSTTAVDAELETALAAALDQAGRPDIDASIDRLLAGYGIGSAHRAELTAAVEAAMTERAELHGPLQALLQGRRERRGLPLTDMARELQAHHPAVNEQTLRRVETGQVPLVDGLDAAAVAAWALLLDIDEVTLARTAQRGLALQRGQLLGLAAGQEAANEEALRSKDEAFLTRLLKAFEAQRAVRGERRPGD